MSVARCDECTTSRPATVHGLWCAPCYDTLMGGTDHHAADPDPVAAPESDGGPYRLEAWAASDGSRWGRP